MGLRSKLGNKLFKLAAWVSPNKKKGVSTMNVSFPNKAQIVHGIERVAIVYVLAVAAYLKATPDQFSTSAWHAAAIAGVAAVYQFALSTLTNL